MPPYWNTIPIANYPTDAGRLNKGGNTMMDHRGYSGHLMILALIIGLAVTPLALAENDSITVNKLQFTTHSDGTVSAETRAIPLERLLSKISETTNIDIYVDNKSKNRPVTIDVNNIPLIQLLKRIAGDNYVMVYDSHNVSALHVLSTGETHQDNNADAITEFSGQVKVTNQHARMFFTPSGNTKDAIENYINKRHEALAELSKKDPQKELHAQISFQGYMSAEQIVSFVKQNQLDPVTLNIGWKENGGGYDLKHGESIEDAIEAAASHHKRFIAQLQEDADAQVASLRQTGASDVQMQVEIAFQKNANDLNSVFQTNGIPFYGIRVAANASQLNSITNDDQAIRLVDPLWGGTVEDEITNTYPTKKIAIPLVPDKEVFIP